MYSSTFEDKTAPTFVYVSAPMLIRPANAYHSRASPPDPTFAIHWRGEDV
jgi:hypothetical protein